MSVPVNLWHIEFTENDRIILSVKEANTIYNFLCFKIHPYPKKKCAFLEGMAVLVNLCHREFTEHN